MLCCGLREGLGVTCVAPEGGLSEARGGPLAPGTSQHSRVTPAHPQQPPPSWIGSHAGGGEVTPLEMPSATSGRPAPQPETPHTELSWGP